MRSVLYVDSRMPSYGNDSSFQVYLGESLHLESHGMRLDKIRFTNSFRTTDLAENAFYMLGRISALRNSRAGLHGYTISRGYPNSSCTDDNLLPNTNAITQAITAGQEWLSEEALRAYSAGFPTGASSNAP